MADSSVRRDQIRWSLGVFAIALALRGLVLWQLSGSLLLDTIIGDARNYDQWARRLAAGDWLGSEVFYQAPLYPYFLGAVYSLSGGEVLFARCLQIVVGAASCALLTQAGWRFVSKPVGIAAGLLLACYAPAVVSDVAIGKSVLDIFFVCLLLRILGGMNPAPRPGPSLGLGLSLGMLILSRENALAFLAVLAPWLALRATTWRQRIEVTGLFAVGIALVLVPVAVRNWHVGGEFHLTTSQFGHNFFIGNNAAADGTYAPVVPRRGEPQVERQDAIDLAERAMGRSLTPAEVSAYFSGEALRYIRSQPLDWLALMGRKVVLAFNAIELVDTKDQYSHHDLSSVLRSTGGLLHFGVLAPLALLGVWVTWSDRARLLPIYLLFLVYTSTLLVFYMFARYRIPLIPMLALFAAAAVVRFPEFLRENRAPRIAAGIAAASAAAVCCNWPIADEDYMRSVTQYNLGNELAGAGRIEDAMERYREAVRLFEGNAVAHHNLGALLAGKGELERARSHYERALQLVPDYMEARLNLAITHVDLGLAEAAKGDLSLAIESFERALELDPSLEEARANLSNAQAQMMATPP
jgi:hypothetical protein